MTALIRVGAFDGFGDSRTSQFWQFRDLSQWSIESGQGLLFAGSEKPRLPEIPLKEPSPLENLRAEQELLGFPVSGHPLDMFPDVDWTTYCPISELAHYCGERVTIAGLIIEDRIHHQADGRRMKFLSVCDRSGILECELFADAYKRFGVETIRHPVVEISGKVTPTEPGTGQTLRVARIQKPRSKLPRE